MFKKNGGNFGSNNGKIIFGVAFNSKRFLGRTLKIPAQHKKPNIHSPIP